MRFSRQPLHVRGVIASAFAERDNMIDLALAASERFRMGPLELGNGIGIALDLAVAVSGAGFAFDRTTGLAGMALIAVRRG